MSRWRPPPEKSTALVTRAGHERLKAELDELWRVKRPEVVRALAAAAAEGDRSENAEYTYRKKQLGEIDRAKINVKGSSLAYGHPFAATGARILGMTAKLLHTEDKERALISVCTAGGMGVTALVERAAA